MKVLHVFTVINTPRAFFDGQFRYLSEHGQEIHVATDSPEDSGFSQRNGITYHQIGIARSISPFTDLKSIRDLAALIRREKFDVVVGHTPKGAMVAMIAARLANVKKRVYYRHGLIYTTAYGIKRSIFKAVERLTSAFSTDIVNVSHSLSRLAVKDRLNPERKQRVIGLGTCGGIDTMDVFNPALVKGPEIDTLRLSLGLEKDNFVVGFCGRICKDKGIRELIDGFRKYHEAHPEARLLLVGAYDTRDILPQEYKDEIERNPFIISTGRVEKEKLPLYYSLMNVFVFPSYREGFGMTVLEASAMRLPVLVSRSHGCEDSIEEGQTGEYIDLSAEGIAGGLESISVSSRNYGASGREWVRENFDCKEMWPQIQDYYTSLQKSH